MGDDSSCCVRMSLTRCDLWFSAFDWAASGRAIEYLTVVDEAIHEAVVIDHEPSLDGEHGDMEVSSAKRLGMLGSKRRGSKRLLAEARLDIEAQKVAFGVKH
jgi:hypothetical protein